MFVNCVKHHGVLTCYAFCLYVALISFCDVVELCCCINDTSFLAFIVPFVFLVVVSTGSLHLW
jgi:hypothetical protein